MTDTKPCQRPGCTNLCRRSPTANDNNWRRQRYCGRKCAEMSRRADGGAGGELTDEDRRERQRHAGRQHGFAAMLDRAQRYGLEPYGQYEHHDVLGWVPTPRWLAERYAGRRHDA